MSDGRSHDMILHRADHIDLDRAEESLRLDWGRRRLRQEQQITILLPNPFLSPDGEKVLTVPDWSRLALWDELRAKWAGAAEPDPFDRSAPRFRH